MTFGTRLCVFIMIKISKLFIIKTFLIYTVYIETMTSLFKDSAISCCSYHPILMVFCLLFIRSSAGFWNWASLDQRDMSSVVQRRWTVNSGKRRPFSYVSAALLKKTIPYELVLLVLGGGGGSEPLRNSGQSDQLPSLHHQGDEQECRWCHRPGQEERWEPKWRLPTWKNILKWFNLIPLSVPLKWGIIIRSGQARQVL